MPNNKWKDYGERQTKADKSNFTFLLMQTPKVSISNLMKCQQAWIEYWTTPNTEKLSALSTRLFKGQSSITREAWWPTKMPIRFMFGSW